MWKWLFKMAWRDSRQSRQRLLLFTSSIIIGIAALVAINSFSHNLQKDVQRQSKSLLGADLSIGSRNPVTSSQDSLFRSFGDELSEESSFASMVYFPKSGGTRLVQVRALEGDYPFYGEIVSEPRTASQSFKTGGHKALIDRTLMMQFNAKIGDSIQLGETKFRIEGELTKVPGQSGIAGTVAPPVFIPLQYLPETNLIQRGSRVFYNYYYRFNETAESEKIAEQLRPELKEEGMFIETVEGRQENVRDAFLSMNRFLNLVAFIALLLGCIGVASSVHIYIREKRKTVAILRCLGVKGTQGFLIYLIQIAVMGLLGSIVGAFLGSMIQVLLPKVVGDFLPVEVSLSISWAAIGQGILIGVSISILFALLPLLAIRKVSPLRTLRDLGDSGNDVEAQDNWRWLVFALIGLFVFGFTYWQIGDLKDAAYFTGGIVAALVVLAGISKLLIWSVRRFFPMQWSYVWRQSLANLYRPNNQTLTLMVCIGLGTALISILFFTQSLLLNQVSIAGNNDRPNMILFDIQTDQKEDMAALTKANGLPVMQEVPVVTMRLAGINDSTVTEMRKDTTRDISRWVLNREYRVSFRDTLDESEKIIAGEWRGRVNSPEDTIFISIAERIQDNMKVGVGDRVSFNVQGQIIETVVGSIRKVDWRRLQSNFFVLFPAGVLEEAPQFHILVTRTPSEQASAKFQQAVVEAHPNVSIVDLTMILETVDDILGKVSFVIQFMALFSILTGLLVLIGSVIISKFQRIKESVLLRTLGASRRQILTINALEYFFLGSLASFVGILLAVAGSWGLAKYTFETPFTPDWTPVVVTFFVITVLTVVLGMLNSRDVLNKPPLEVLRMQVG
ncbi:MAG: FtsX-like permease family protein [Chitinophagales bacterium]